MAKSNRRRSVRGSGTWRTTNLFGTPIVQGVGVATPIMVCANIPQAPVAAGMPEPVSEYEVSTIQGGLEPGLITLTGAVTSPVLVTAGFGLYMADYDPVTGNFEALDPLLSTDIPRDNWTHTEYHTMVAGETGTPVLFTWPPFTLDSHPMSGKWFRFTSGPRRIKEGRALMASINIAGPAGTTFSVTPFFRYYLKRIT